MAAYPQRVIAEINTAVSEMDRGADAAARLRLIHLRNRLDREAMLDELREAVASLEADEEQDIRSTVRALADSFEPF